MIGSTRAAIVFGDLSMPYQFTMTRRVEFSDTDMAGIMHFSNFFRFMEAAEHAFFRSFGASVVTSDGSRKIGFPRVRVACRYHRPARFEDDLTVRLIVREVRARRIRYEFLFHREQETQGRPLARGEMEVACVEHAGDGVLRATDIPSEILEHIQSAPSSVIESLERIDA